ncbi:eCIS core domain-containing protein [Dyella sp. 2RAB6]|uniref:eCIS core domain-containing protein n=1 Tax=Dyella sp. 2RAB6 TaxID=3232992 RepID=UPI003F8FF3CB
MSERVAKSQAAPAFQAVAHSAASAVLQRKCACGTHTPGGGQCRACSERQVEGHAEHAAAADQVPATVHEALGGPGRPLDDRARRFFEPRFGRDLGGVRIHTDGSAARSARDVDAQAYTSGRHIVFADGKYAPDSMMGSFLLAHELSHVMQQRQQDTRPLTIGNRNDAFEHEADRTAMDVLTRPVSSVAPMVGADPSATLRRGWPLVAAGVVGVGAVLYAAWAYHCLTPLERPMYDETFGDAVHRAGGFRLWYYNQTHAPLSSNVWDAFGHCWIACASTKRCGAFTARLAGSSREFYREYIDSSPHDSYAQDINNQRLGRGFGSNGDDCTTACRNAALPGGAMDLSAPAATHWDPTSGDTA